MPPPQIDRLQLNGAAAERNLQDLSSRLRAAIDGVLGSQFLRVQRTTIVNVSRIQALVTSSFLSASSSGFSRCPARSRPLSGRSTN